MSKRHRARDCRRSQIGEQTAELIRKWNTADPRWLARKRRKKRQIARILKGIALMVLTPFVLIPLLIATGLLLGPRGVEGLVTAPLAIIVTWAIILYWMLRRRASPKRIQQASVAQLPAETEAWLDDQRPALPAAAKEHLDNIALRLGALGTQVEGLDPKAPAAFELRRLLAEELPELVRGYRKVPRHMVHEPLYGGASPERRLMEGLETIDKQVTRVHENLAADDLKALATHQRYLELKYKREDDIE